MTRTRGTPSPWGFLAFPLAILLLFTALPSLAGVVLSFFEWSGGGRPRWVGLLNYRALGADRQMWLALRSTLLFAAVTVPLTALGSFLLAVGLHARWFRGAGPCRVMLFLPTVMSIVAVGFVWQWLLNPRAGVLGLVGGTGSGRPDLLADTWLGLGTLILVQVWRSLGFGVVIYAAALSRVPRTMYDAASIDGAGAWQRTWRITWPAVRPITGFLLVIGAVWALQVFDLDLVMTGWNPQRWNDVLNTHLFREFKSGRLGYASTLGVVVLALSAAVTWAQLRAWRAAEAA